MECRRSDNFPWPPRSNSRSADGSKSHTQATKQTSQSLTDHPRIIRSFRQPSQPVIDGRNLNTTLVPAIVRSLGRMMNSAFMAAHDDRCCQRAIYPWRHFKPSVAWLATLDVSHFPWDPLKRERLTHVCGATDRGSGACRPGRVLSGRKDTATVLARGLSLNARL